ncbi:hypothetical protein OAK97_00400 [bacterium]|nr:hypothetical protein [bacterium]
MKNQNKAKQDLLELPNKGARRFAKTRAKVCLLLAGLLLTLPGLKAQVSSVVFEDDFSSNEINAGSYTSNAPFFEGGQGDIHAEPGDGVMRFVGVTTQQWWSGGTLKVNETYSATQDAPVTISIDRISEDGQGSASRSALWIHDETENNYVLFADVRGEGGWRYNRKIGQDGDVPTGGGNNMSAFDGEAYDDGGLHNMSIVANGSTVQLLLDGELGAEVPFPFNNVVFQFGSYARADNDTADTAWDNLKISTVLTTTAVFADDFSSNTLDAAKYEAAEPFFEGGEGDIHAEAGDGVMRFVGTTTQQWWSGGTLRLKESFNASSDAPVTISIDRVAEDGQGSASRSALWIYDESESNYVLFADVRGEGGWRYNRKIGEDGDVPTGGGNNIAAFNGEAFDDGGLHNMSMVANGSTVQLILDGEVGAEVAFPFSPVVFHFGSFARADNDTADTTWDNLEVLAVPQQTNVVFSDDFSSNGIDSGVYEPATPFFEGGEGDIHAEHGDGVMRFVGTTTQQWWSGGTLRVAQSFEPSGSETITLAIDRVAEAGQGSASRSALWIYDETESNYVLFADVRGEGGWRYNRKIGQDGDVPTGGGNNMAAFDGEAFDDGGLHTMSMIANGATVKLLLDGIEGADVAFPFSPVYFHFGSFARADNDTADTTWDNLVIESEGGATFVTSGIGVRKGMTSQPVTVRIPQGLNSQKSISVSIVSDDPSIAVPEGGSNGRLSLTFPAGGANTATFRVVGNDLGGTQFAIESAAIASANKLDVAVISDPGVVLTEDFAGGSIDSSNFEISEVGFGNGVGAFTVEQDGGQLTISGFTDEDGWPGASLRTKKSYLATEDLNLVVEVDRVAIDQFGSAGRVGVFLTNNDRSRFVFVSQHLTEDESSWRVNTNPGSPTGGGAVVTAFGGMDGLGSYAIKLVANGSTVEVFLDGVSGGSFAFEQSAGIHVELGAYAQFLDDDVKGVFDNLKIENTLPCIVGSPWGILMTQAERQEVTVSVPRLVNDSNDISVTIKSSNANVAVPGGGSNGSLTLVFPAGGSNTQTFTAVPVGLGAAVFELSTSADVCVAADISVEVISIPEVFLTDNFAGDSFDDSKWRVDETPFNDSGVLKPAPDSIIEVKDGHVIIHVEAEQAAWPGMALLTSDTYGASQVEPLTFSIDRKMVDFVLAAGVSSESRTGIWAIDGKGNSVFFVDHTTHDSRNYGWRYNRIPGDTDNEETGSGVNIPSFDGGTFDNRGDHRMKIVLNGSTAKLFLDDVFGAEVPFPASDGITLGFGAYADDIGPPDPETEESRGNQTTGFFDNAEITGGSVPYVAQGNISGFAVQDGNLVIEWEGNHLMEAASVTGPFTPVDGANPPSTSVSLDGTQRFFIAE